MQVVLSLSSPRQNCHWGLEEVDHVFSKYSITFGMVSGDLAMTGRKPNLRHLRRNLSGRVLTDCSSGSTKKSACRPKNEDWAKVLTMSQPSETNMGNIHCQHILINCLEKRIIGIPISPQRSPRIIFTVVVMVSRYLESISCCHWRHFFKSVARINLKTDKYRFPYHLMNYTVVYNWPVVFARFLTKSVTD